jgi:hypothetical protein
MSEHDGPVDPWGEFGEELDGALGRAAKWAQKRRKRIPGRPLTILDSGETTTHKWSGLASAVEGIALAGSPGAGPAITLLKAVYGVEDAQAAMLSSIDRQVRLLREGPFRSGQLLLREAERVGPAAGEEYSEFLAKARDRFYDAHGLAASVQERALVEFHLGLVAVLTGKQADAKHWLGQCYASCTQVVEELVSKSKNIKVLRSRKTTAALTLSTYGLYVIPVKLKRVWNAELAAGALDSFTPFVNCVASSLDTVSDAPQASKIRFEPTDHGSYVVRYEDPAETGWSGWAQKPAQKPTEKPENKSG